MSERPVNSRAGARPAVTAGVSGLVLGLGTAVLLQQFAVWPLTVWTLIVLPVAAAVVAGLVVARLSKTS